ncbi:alanine racemase [Flavisphingomonas formosensis]|uniref:alanine racemase n=1 Tax=Flavisphingomonas formosensis TaxID=861534 RepID=UPI0012FC8FF4|nr:alanine racemase [Sphingomonas formosensis]
MISPDAPLRLTLDTEALVANWRWLAQAGGRAACGAAVKADAYGLGARQVVERLAAAGCRDFFVATWAEAAALGDWPDGLSLSVLHGVREADVPFAQGSRARPVLNSIGDVRRWRAAGGGPCDVMIDTGMNRLGLAPEDTRTALLDGLEIRTLMSHLACADEDHAMNEAQLFTFRGLKGAIAATRYSLANSAGVCLGARYAFGLTRPGIALYGGIPRPEADGHIRQVVRVEAQVLQRRRVPQGGSVGYGATFVAERATEIAVLNIGYADGYLRIFSGGTGRARAGGVPLPVIGRVSMDLTAVDVSAMPDVAEGDWVEIDYNLSETARLSGLTQYELLTLLGRRYQRRWV